jgi:hypothetical protein
MGWRSNSADEPHRRSVGEFFSGLRDARHGGADAIGYSEVVQEDGLCGGPCVAEEIRNAFPCAPFIQYAYRTDTPANPGMWHFLVVAFDRDATGWKVIGLLEDAWSP